MPVHCASPPFERFDLNQPTKQLCAGKFGSAIDSLTAQITVDG
jgi:hypothetical protein